MEVMFKRGLQDHLTGTNSLNSTHSAQPGTFYLTSDTNRLYIGISNPDTAVGGGIAVPVNQGVTTVESVDELTLKTNEAGQFYYVTDGNILCIWNGSKFVQINSNTDTNTYISDFAVTLEVEKDGEGAPVENGYVASKITITEATKNVDGSMGANTTFSQTIKFIGDNGVTITSEDGKVKISGDTYTLATAAGDDNNQAKITLSATNASDNSSNIVLQGSGATSVEKLESGNIEISSFDTQLDSLERILPGDKDDEDNVIGEAGKIKYTITDTSDNSLTAIFDSKVIYGSKSNVPTASVTNRQIAEVNDDGNYVLSVYTKDEVDNVIASQLQNFDAMMFKGGVGGLAGSLPTLANSSNGDVYKVVEENAYFTDGTAYNVTDAATKTVAHIGDLFIASGTEDATGHITSGSWVYVPSGYNPDTTYTFTGIAGETGTDEGESGFQAASSDDVDSYSYKHLFKTGDTTTGSGLTVGTTYDSTAKKSVTSISHRAVTLDNTTNTVSSYTDENRDTYVQKAYRTLTIPVESVKLDTYGHIIGKTINEYQVLDSVSTFKTSFGAISTTTEDGVTTQSTTLTLQTIDTTDNSFHDSGTIKLSSSTLKFTQENDANVGGVNIELEWGEFVAPTT